MTKEDPRIARASALPTANIGDALDRLYVTAARIKPVWPGARLAGPAYTVLTAPGDNRAIHEALDTAEPGEVIVVAAGGYTDRALIGELMSQRGAVRRLAGMVLDGAVRDAADIAVIGFPVFAVGITPAGPYRNGPGLQQVPVSIGDVVVRPGDLVVADDDGVVIIPEERIDDVLAAAELKHDVESAQRAAIGARVG